MLEREESTCVLSQNWIFLSFSLWCPAVPIRNLPSVFLTANITLDWFSFSISDQAQSERHCCNVSHEEIAVVALGLGCSWLRCCLHRAPHNIFAVWVPVLCHSWVHYPWWRPATLLTDVQRLLVLLKYKLHKENPYAVEETINIYLFHDACCFVLCIYELDFIKTPSYYGLCSLLIIFIPKKHNESYAFVLVLALS